MRCRNCDKMLRNKNKYGLCSNCCSILRKKNTNLVDKTKYINKLIFEKKKVKVCDKCGQRIKEELKEDIIGLSLAYFGVLLLTLDGCNNFYVCGIIRSLLEF